MSNRSRDWLAQAVRDLEQARSSKSEARHEWACFAAHQSAEKAVMGLHLALGQEAWGHVVSRLLVELPVEPPADLVDKARVLTTSTFRLAMPTGTRKERLLSITGRFRVKRRSDMPVRSLSSSVMRWPDRKQVDAAVRSWAASVVARHSGLLRLGYFGSYAREDWGVGSDVDLVAIVDSAAEPFERRSAKWDLAVLPVPADLLEYTLSEWQDLGAQGGRFALTLERETVWVYERQPEIAAT